MVANHAAVVVAVGASVKSAGSSPKKRERCVMIEAIKGTGGETAQNGPDVEETASRKDLSSLRMALAAATVAVGLVNLGLLLNSFEAPKVVSATAVSQGPSSRTRAQREQEKEQQKRTRMHQQRDDKSVSHRAVRVELLTSDHDNERHTVCG